MPRDLFDVSTRPALGGRTRYTLPVSIVLHVVALAAVAIVPLLATGTMPAPYRALFLEYVRVAPPPPPPPVRPVVSANVPAATTTGAPVTAPEGVQPETGLQITPRRDGDALFADATAGIVEGVPEGLVQGERPVAVPAPAPSKPQRVGGVIRLPRKLVDVAPVYPYAAVQARVEGVVIIDAVIGPGGDVVDASVTRSVPLLDEAALAAVRQWKYAPTMLNGVPVPVIMTVTVQFRLR